MDSKINPSLKSLSRKLSHLKLDERNARSHPERNIKLIADSLDRFGQQKPIVVDTANMILAGNGTVLAARSLNWTEIAAVVIDVKDEAMRKAFALMDNRTAELADWDALNLQEALAALELQGFHAQEIGFEQEELAALIARLNAAEPSPVSGLTDPDAVPDLPKEPTTKVGDLWELGDHHLLCGDALSGESVGRLLNGTLADMVFTDPPYGVSYQSNMRTKTPQFNRIANDDVMLTIAPTITKIMSPNSAAFIWTTHKVYVQWRQQFEDLYRSTVIWYKAGGGMGDLEGDYALDYEMALFCVKGDVRFRGKRGMAVWPINKDHPGSYVHPTQKPVALAEQAMKDFTDVGNSVVDLFGGSGSTLIACERFKRRCMMMEMSPAYCDVITTRWELFTGQKARRLSA